MPSAAGGRYWQIGSEMDDVEVTRHGDLEIATAKGEGPGFTAWAKMGRIQSDCPIKEPGAHVWFNFSTTREESIERILVELGLRPKVGDERRL